MYRNIQKKYHFKFFGKEINENGKSIYLNCAFDKGDKNYVIAKNRRKISSFYNNKKIIFVNQIHSNKIYHFKKKIDKKIRADGIITNSQEVLLGILTADCAPIIIFGEKYFGILHVGWRGLLDGIIENAVKLLVKKGEKLKEIVMYVGPHLRMNSFEVKSDFIDNIRNLRNYSNYLKDHKNRIFFNYTKLIEDKIKELKIEKYKITKYNTFTSPKKFFSHRYSMKNELKDCGRQLSIVGFK